MTRPPYACLLAPALLVLAGCTGSTDPATATLFDNIHNLQTGEYDRQIAVKDAEAAAIISNNNAAQARINAKEGQVAANSSAIAALRGQIAAARSAAAAVRPRIADDPAKLARLTQLESQLSAVEGDIDAGADPAVARAEISRVSAAIRALAG